MNDNKKFKKKCRVQYKNCIEKKENLLSIIYISG